MHAVRALCALGALSAQCALSIEISKIYDFHRAYKRSVGGGLNCYPCSTTRDTDRHERFPSTGRLPNVLQLAFDKCCRAPTVFRTYFRWSVDSKERARFLGRRPKRSQFLSKSVHGSWVGVQIAHNYCRRACAVLFSAPTD